MMDGRRPVSSEELETGGTTPAAAFPKRRVKQRALRLHAPGDTPSHDPPPFREYPELCTLGKCWEKTLKQTINLR